MNAYSTQTLWLLRSSLLTESPGDTSTARSTPTKRCSTHTTCAKSTSLAFAWLRQSGPSTSWKQNGIFARLVLSRTIWSMPQSVDLMTNRSLRTSTVCTASMLTVFSLAGKRTWENTWTFWNGSWSNTRLDNGPVLYREVWQTSCLLRVHLSRNVCDLWDWCRSRNWGWEGSHWIHWWAPFQSFQTQS